MSNYTAHVMTVSNHPAALQHALHIAHSTVREFADTGLDDSSKFLHFGTGSISALTKGFMRWVKARNLNLELPGLEVYMQNL